MSAGGEEKTEEPTAKRRQDARNKGNIAKSRDMSAALQLLAAIYILKYFGPSAALAMKNLMVKMIREDMAGLAIPERKELIPYALDWCLWLGYMLGPFLALMFVAAYVTGYLQVGFLFTTEQIKLDLTKLNPVSGLKRIFSAKNLVTLAMNLGKLLIVLPVAWATMYGEFQNVITMVDMEAAGIFIWMTSKVLRLAETLALLLLALGLMDFYYQKFSHNKGMKMTKQEVKEEFKQMEGDPRVKQKRRQKQMELAMQRMMQEVPQAEVVVRNPTHFAVAISYKPGMPAPVVVAKGKDKVAERIIEEARKARVPLVENPPLARQLYAMVEVGEKIPEDLFAAVAEILASVMDAEKRHKLMESMAA